MSRKTQNYTQSHSSPNGVAWAALFFALIAFSISGFLLFDKYKDRYQDSEWRENLKSAGEDTSKLFGRLKKRFDERGNSGDGSWDSSKVKRRIERIEEMIRDKDDRASIYLDVLTDDLEVARDYMSEKSSKAVGRTLEALNDVRDRLKTDSAEAFQRLKKLKNELEPNVREMFNQDDEPTLDDPDDFDTPEDA